jgi:hypothetical protein
MHALPGYDRLRRVVEGGLAKLNYAANPFVLSNTPESRAKLRLAELGTRYRSVVEKTGSESAEPEFAGLMDSAGCLRRGKPFLTNH